VFANLPRLNWAKFRDPVVFGIIGCISAACYVALGVLFSRLPGVRPSMALAGALIVMLLPNYAAQRTLTFRSRRNHRQALPRYLVTQAISNLLGMVLSELFADQVAARPWVAITVVAFVIAAVNFTLLKLWTFVGSGDRTPRPTLG
jgi:putative flippase GtrA